MKLKEQFNVRIVPELKNAVAGVRADSDFTQDEIAEVALAVLFGSKDKLIEAKHEKIRLSFKKTGVRLPFEMPLTPFIRNAA